MTPRLVLDTNVLVAAGFRQSSASAALVARVRDGAVVLVWNDATRAEAEAVLRRIPRLDWAGIRPLFDPAGRFEAPTEPEAFAGVSDPSDRKFAVAKSSVSSPLKSARVTATGPTPVV